MATTCDYNSTDTPLLMGVLAGLVYHWTQNLVLPDELFNGVDVIDDIMNYRYLKRRFN